MNTPHSGFTTIELLISLFVAAALVGTFYQLFAAADQGNRDARFRASASALAYSNLRKYNTKPASFICNNTTDLVANSSAPGQVISTNTTNSNHPSGLPSPVVETIIAWAPAGCGSNKPVLINAIVTYGPQERSIRHGTYVN
ncbi:MAG TPA: hypothetical protein VD907_01070 [Verrucomicrobiae bacterium]|nr:hypothetical protein [Verrucomicrobiae bacterium]